MTKISLKQIEHIAKLSGLEISQKETKLFSNQLSEILNYVSELNKINTNQVEPFFQTTDLENIWRDDIVKPSEIKKETFLSNASKQEDDFMIVEKMFEKE